MVEDTYIELRSLMVFDNHVYNKYHLAMIFLILYFQGYGPTETLQRFHPNTDHLFQ